MRSFLRWLWSGQRRAVPVLRLCPFCERDSHVHDANTGQCITIGCQCRARR